jgi:hypothetical protein
MVDGCLHGLQKGGAWCSVNPHIFYILTAYDTENCIHLKA